MKNILLESGLLENTIKLWFYIMLPICQSNGLELLVLGVRIVHDFVWELVSCKQRSNPNTDLDCFIRLRRLLCRYDRHWISHLFYFSRVRLVTCGQKIRPIEWGVLLLFLALHNHASCILNFDWHIFEFKLCKF